jgi:hypothetical protein
VQSEPPMGVRKATLEANWSDSAVETFVVQATAFAYFTIVRVLNVVDLTIDKTALDYH